MQIRLKVSMSNYAPGTIVDATINPVTKEATFYDENGIILTVTKDNYEEIKSEFLNISGTISYNLINLLGIKPSKIQIEL